MAYTPQHGPGWPLLHVTVDPGGTTIVVLFGGGGGLSWKLRHPARPSGTSKTSRILPMRCILSGCHRIQVVPRRCGWDVSRSQMVVVLCETPGPALIDRLGAKYAAAFAGVFGGGKGPESRAARARGPV